MTDSQPLKLAYTAGFIEADGCFQITNSGIGIRITNKHLPTLERFIEWWGGAISKKNTPIDCYDWNLHGVLAEELLISLLEHLNMKHKEAYLLLKFQETVGPRGKKLTEETKEYRENIKKELKLCRKSR